MRGVLALVLVTAAASVAFGAGVTLDQVELEGSSVFRLDNGRLTSTLSISDGRLLRERLTLDGVPVMTTDGGFAADLVWAGWQAPGMVNNAENPVTLTHATFVLEGHEAEELDRGGRVLHLDFRHEGDSLRARLSYRLEPGDFFIRRRLSFSDPEDRGHFLHRTWPLACSVRAPGGLNVVKAGGFGQPAALGCRAGGAFFGVEYPAADNGAAVEAGTAMVRCGQLVGQRIGPQWVAGEWAVQGLTPDAYLRCWFHRYLDDVRVAPLRPYTLYNSWYDLRAPEMVEYEANVMNGQNIERIMASFRRHLLEPYGVGLDAFVLDDGWDIYRSDWVLRDEQFPEGLAPVARSLDGDGTELGIWFGPTGGYSHRDWRLEWMRAEGYETVGDQLCLAGEHYRQLFEKRVTDLVVDHDIGYFKWDGIQFSCSEPDHGHPVGLYSRRAVLETVIDLCRAVREKKPDIFLNVTSGTWLSPWWVGHADTIWMQGYDYGYADVPSISRRDRAITYRDCVLHDGLVKNDFWFPMANLMTHGIIKGDLQKLGGEAEPLDKFTDNALLYVARGVSMYELYVSPDLLSAGEWKAIAESLLWAEDRFEVLDDTVAIGGDPAKREPYGYAHFEGDRGILALRNPFAENHVMEVTLSPALGLDPGATDLVLERVYPTRLIEPALFMSGLTLHLELQGYETAVYEIFPLSGAPGPLLAGAVFEVEEQDDQRMTVHCLDNGAARLLNPEAVRTVLHDGGEHDPASFRLPLLDPPAGEGYFGATVEGGPGGWDVVWDFGAVEPDHPALADLSGLDLSLLWEPEEGAAPLEACPLITATVDGQRVELEAEAQAGRWSWHTLRLDRLPGRAVFHLAPAGESGAVTGKVLNGVLWRTRPEPRVVTLLFEKSASPRPMPPAPRPAGELWNWTALGWQPLR